LIFKDGAGIRINVSKTRIYSPKHARIEGPAYVGS